MSSSVSTHRRRDTGCGVLNPGLLGLRANRSPDPKGKADFRCKAVGVLQLRRSARQGLHRSEAKGA